MNDALARAREESDKQKEAMNNALAKLQKENEKKTQDMLKLLIDAKDKEVQSVKVCLFFSFAVFLV